MERGGIMKKTKNCEEEKDKDRLSSLPDAIIHHIFAFLDTRLSVQTCVLSRRWKALWASSPNIHFGGDAFDEHWWFKKFVEEFFSRRDDIPLTRVYLCDSKKYSVCRENSTIVGELKKSLAETIIRYAVSHGVEHLTASSNYSPMAFLSPVDGSQSLKTLHLSGFREVSLLSLFDLPMLTTLHLIECSFRSIGSIGFLDRDPFASLINLKSLILIKFNYSDFTDFKISGPQLERLIIDSMYSYNGGAGFKVEIFAPKLKSFSVRNTKPFEFCNLDVPLLESAYVDVHIPRFKDIKKLEDFRLNLIHMLRGLYHAESFKISPSTIEVLTSWRLLVKDFDGPQLRKFIEYTSKFDELLF